MASRQSLENKVVASQLNKTWRQGSSLVVALTGAEANGWSEDLPAYVKILDDGRILIEPYAIEDVQDGQGGVSAE